MSLDKLYKQIFDIVDLPRLISMIGGMEYEYTNNYKWKRNLHPDEYKEIIEQIKVAIDYNLERYNETQMSLSIHIIETIIHDEYMDMEESMELFNKIRENVCR